ncbi:MAG: helix-turn-helix transcriptional regulator [Bacilli bacterium]|nr:helix-turn-helix transcriptional regulator [Bacilli bacterium]
MLGEKIANLRKEKKVSQEELADVLCTSRQAVSKWERGESDPDIGRLKDLAIYFGVSIDYLLGYDLESMSVNGFIERIKKNIEDRKYDIGVDEIRLIVSKNSNNFILLGYALAYLQDYNGLHHQSELNDLIIDYYKKAITSYQADNPFNVSLNALYGAVAYSYIVAKQYDLAKQWIKEHKVYGAESALSRCELELGNSEEAQKITTDGFLEAIGSVINNSTIQTIIHLRNNKYGDALELVDWLIRFVRSIGKSEEALIDILFVLSFIKATCLKILCLGYEDEYAFLKDNQQKVVGYRHLEEGLRFIAEQDIYFSTGTGEVKKDLLDEIEYLKNDEQAYAKAMDLYRDIFKES